MSYRGKARRLAKAWSREIRASLEEQPFTTWEIIPHPPEARITQLKHKAGSTVITIQPSKQLPAVRIFDRCSLAYDGCDAWLPLLQRIRLKNAVRLWILRKRLQKPLT